LGTDLGPSLILAHPRSFLAHFFGALAHPRSSSLIPRSFFLTPSLILAHPRSFLAHFFGTVWIDVGTVGMPDQAVLGLGVFCFFATISAYLARIMVFSMASLCFQVLFVDFH